MNVLVIGGGGREHAIIWKLRQNKDINKIFAIPGNAGISEIAECFNNISVMDFAGIAEFLNNHKDINLTVVAPDDPLAGGLVNYLNDKGYRAFGPTKEAALIEGSKAFSKYLMQKYNIPTAKYQVFDVYEQAVDYIRQNNIYPIVIKADGLALGKGVIICNTEVEAIAGLDEIMVNKRFKSAGSKVVIEEFLKGREVSVLCFTDGKTIVPMISSQDHKRVFDEDKGGNTGGMGTFAPSPFYTKTLSDKAYTQIILPTMNALSAENRKFKGVLYFGLMIDGEDIKVLEYNARFGDPETQVILPLLKTDLVEIFNAIIDERLNEINIEWEKSSCVCVILASEGYPEQAVISKKINIDNRLSETDIMLFHAGTKFNENNDMITSGGRVIGVTAKADSLENARDKVYNNIKSIHFDGMHYRKDIGKSIK